MSMAVFVLKTALLRYGITIDQVRFDVGGECIVVEYQLHGQAQTKSVPFAEIESLFSESTGRQSERPPVDELPAEGARAPGG